MARPVLALALMTGLGLPIVAIGSCQSPTQITVDVRTHGFKCSEIKHLLIAVAGDPYEAEKRLESGFVAVDIRPTCEADDRVGTLVVTPNDSNGAIIVAASYDTEKKCTPP